MAVASSTRADRPGSDRALSSDEEDFVSSHSTASLDQDDHLETNQLSNALSKVHMDQKSSNNSSEDSTTTRTSTPLTAMSMPAAPADRPKAKSLQLLDLPLDVLKDIVKEVWAVHPT